MAITFVASSEFTNDSPKVIRYDAPGNGDYGYYGLPELNTPARFDNDLNTDFVEFESDEDTIGMLVTATIVTKGSPITPPAGWVLIRNDTGAGILIASYYKIVTASEPAFWTFTTSAGQSIFGMKIRIDNVDVSGDPVRSSGFVVGSGNTLAIPALAANSEDFVYYVSYTDTGDLWPYEPSFGDVVQPFWGSVGGMHNAYIRGARNNGMVGPWNATLTTNNDAAVNHALIFKRNIPAGLLRAPKPAGVVAGDVMIASLLLACAPAGTNYVTPPAGWTRLEEGFFDPDGDVESYFSNYDGAQQSVFYKVATNSEPAEYEFFVQDRGGYTMDYVPFHGWIEAYRGVDQTNPIADSSSASGPHTANLVVPSVTAAAANSMLLTIGGYSHWSNPRPVISPPTGQTLVDTTGPYGSNDNESMGSVGRETVGAGATGTRQIRRIFAPNGDLIWPFYGKAGQTIEMTGSGFTGTSAMSMTDFSTTYPVTTFNVVSDTQVDFDVPVSVPLGNHAIQMTTEYGGPSVVYNGYEVSHWHQKAIFPDYPTTVRNRRGHATILLNDGKILLVGGSDMGFADYVADCWLWDPALDTWTQTGSLNTGRDSFGIAKLQDGRILVAGGSSGVAGIQSCEIYNPATGLWTTTGSLSRGRYDFTLTTLADGSVLAVGGESIFSGNFSEKFDAGTGTWGNNAAMASTPSMHHSVLLNNGNVMVLHGNSLADPLLYNAGANTWGTTASMPTPVTLPGVAKLIDGRVVAIAGSNAGTFASYIQIYNPGTDSWTTLGSVLDEAVDRLHAVTLSGGEVLVCGGTYNTGLSSSSSNSFLINVAADTVTFMGFIGTGLISYGSRGHELVALPSNKAFFACGRVNGWAHPYCSLFEKP